jgi:RNA-directed DNA polymerase
MTAAAVPLTGASSTSVKWESINWKNTETEVHRLQMRIAKAVSEGRHGKVKALQWLLTHSFHAKVMAVKRVVQNLNQLQMTHDSWVNRSWPRKGLSRVRGNSQALVLRGLPSSNGGRLLDKMCVLTCARSFL